MSAIRIGILGCANVAQKHIIPNILALPEYSLIAISSRDKAKATHFGSLYNCCAEASYESLIRRSDVDAIYIPLPVGLHHYWTKRSLNSGKHVLVEKSFTHDPKTAGELIKLAAQKKLVIMENFMFLYHSQQDYVKRQVDGGLIGNIRCFRSSFGFPPLTRDNIRYKQELGGGALLDAGTYTIRVSQLFLGRNLNVAAATLFIDPQLGVDIFGGAFLTNDSGLFSEIAFGFDNFYQCGYEIWGSLGKITVERAFTAGPNFSPKIVIEHQGKKNVVQLPADNHAQGMLREFSQATKNQNKRINFYDEIMDQAKIIHDVRTQANRARKRANVPGFH